MNISKDGKMLYFSDEEIDNETNGEKRVFVTKRINGKETHTKIEKKKSVAPKIKEREKEAEAFNFNKEIVIGVNSEEEKERKEKIKERKNKRKKNKQKNKTRKIKKKFLGIISIIMLIAIVVIIALTAPIFNITEITVEGNEKISSNEIISLSELKKGENIFRFNNKIIDKIKENNYIESVKITRALPEEVKIEIKEREVKYQINLINSYVYIDKNGYILENSTIKKNVPVIVGKKVQENELLEKDRLEEEDIEKLNGVARILESAKAIEIEGLITEINVEDKEEYILYLESKNKKIYVGDTSNLTNKMLYIQKIIQNEEGKSGIAFVNGDIRSGFKPYFREE